jgi:S-adenosylmethionine decarboxylase
MAERGVEWLIEAHGCDAGRLACRATLESLFDVLASALDLHPLQKTRWHQFPVTGGITGVSLLTESHLTCHSFPEYGSICVNVFCCRERPDADFAALLGRELCAKRVDVRRVERSWQP